MMMMMKSLFISICFLFHVFHVFLKLISYRHNYNIIIIYIIICLLPMVATMRYLSHRLVVNVFRSCLFISIESIIQKIHNYSIL